MTCLSVLRRHRSSVFKSGLGLAATGPTVPFPLATDSGTIVFRPSFGAKTRHVLRNSAHKTQSRLGQSEGILGNGLGN